MFKMKCSCKTTLKAAHLNALDASSSSTFEKDRMRFQYYGHLICHSAVIILSYFENNHSILWVAQAKPGGHPCASLLLYSTCNLLLNPWKQTQHPTTPATSTFATLVQGTTISVQDHCRGVLTGLCAFALMPYTYLSPQQSEGSD